MTTSTPTPPTTVTWRIDNDHSHVAFTADKRLFFVKRLQILGRFTAVAGTIAIDEVAPTNSRVTATIDAASVTTQQARRDAHLLKPEFFDAPRFPALTFRSQTIAPVAGAADRYLVTGDLTIRDVTRPVTLDVTTLPGPTDASTPRRRFTTALTLNRRDFGLTWDNPIMHVADDIRVTLDIQATPAS